jgi:indole-3-glycerol phosphate synthase
MILDEIVSYTRKEFENKKRRLPLTKVMEMAQAQLPPLDFASAIGRDDISLIAEVKKASPSKGVIRVDFDATAIARAYATNGAAAISVLTEPGFFQGSLDYLGKIREELQDSPLPLLRKDFILDPYQVYEARAYGADSLLLIAAILSPEKLTELLQLSRRLGMSCLVEVHDEMDVERALSCGAEIIGINNRDLNTFTVDLETSRRLRSLIPSRQSVVSESGIKNRVDIEKLREWGFNAVLVGEALVSARDIPSKMRELL